MQSNPVETPSPLYQEALVYLDNNRQQHVEDAILEFWDSGPSHTMAEIADLSGKLQMATDRPDLFAAYYGM